MKKMILPIMLLLGLALTPIDSFGQCGGGLNPCFDIAAQGSCVCTADGSLQPWLTARILREAKPQLDQCSGESVSLCQYTNRYYLDQNLEIQYLGGSWETGQSFRVVTEGGSITIILTDEG